jgi:hypothetical protein
MGGNGEKWGKIIQKNGAAAASDPNCVWGDLGGWKEDGRRKNKLASLMPIVSTICSISAGWTIHCFAASYLLQMLFGRGHSFYNLFFAPLFLIFSFPISSLSF